MCNNIDVKLVPTDQGRKYIVKVLTCVTGGKRIN